MYILICRGNVTVPVKPNGFKSYYTGDILRNVPDDEAERLLRAYGTSFRVHRRIEDSPEAKSEAPLVEPKEDTKIVAELQAASNQLAEPKDEVVIIPLDDDEHHATVKAYVLDLEEESPINLAKVKAVKEKFSTYKSVVAECDRILSVNGAL